MPLNIPRDTKTLAGFAGELINECYTSLPNRRQRGATFRNLYLSGAEDGTPQTYRKTYTYIQTLAALLYSPVELRFLISGYGASGPRERAMGRAGANVLLEHFRGGNVDTRIEDAVEWGLVKGKTFIQLEWSRGGLEPHMVQPESMGVLREDITSLDRQDAFVHSTWLSKARFADLIADHPNRGDLMKNIANLVSGGEDRPDGADTGRQVIIGGQLYPYRASTAPGAGQGKGMVNWLQAPAPDLAAKTSTDLIRLDELWVWDRTVDDWLTIQTVGNHLIEPVHQFRNLFAEGVPSFAKGVGTTRARKIARAERTNERNPLSGHHPFAEICPNPLPDYFWGWAEILNVAAIQLAINNRVDGINRLLRRQEDPSWIIAGASTPANQIRAKVRRPGGYHTEVSGAQLKIEKMTPDLPVGLWESLHELEAIFDAMAGFPPVMQGQGDSGVRAQGHAETLVRMASPRFKDRALGIERQVEEVGGLALDMLRAHNGEQQVYWVKKNQAGPLEAHALDPMIYEPPAPDLIALPFTMANIPDRFKVTVDSHSSSPVFSQEARELAFGLAQRGAVGPEDLVRMTHPPHEDQLLADIETREANKAATLASLPPEAQIKALTGKAPRKTH